MHIGESFFGQHAGLDPNDTNVIKEQANLLLELVPKQEWSGEDDYNVQCLIAKATYDIQNGNVGRNQELIDWLKSIKPQPHWKPSEEQMKALHDLNLTGNISYAGQGHALIELYNQLEKIVKEHE